MKDGKVKKWKSNARIIMELLLINRIFYAVPRYLTCFKVSTRTETQLLQLPL